MDSEFVALMERVRALPPEQREVAGACEAWTVKDLLAHVSAWHEMFLRWVQEGAEGGKPEMPAPGYTWRMTPELNEAIYEAHRDDAWEDVVSHLVDSHGRARRVVEDADEHLFTKKHLPWTGSTSLGSYAVSATSSHYAWAAKQLRAFERRLPAPS